MFAVHKCIGNHQLHKSCADIIKYLQPPVASCTYCIVLTFQCTLLLAVVSEYLAAHVTNLGCIKSKSRFFVYNHLNYCKSERFCAKYDSKFGKGGHTWVLPKSNVNILGSYLSQTWTYLGPT